MLFKVICINIKEMCLTEFCFLFMNGMQRPFLKAKKKGSRRVDAMLSVEGPGGEGVRTVGRQLALAKRRGTVPFGGGKMVIT